MSETGSELRGGEPLTITDYVTGETVSTDAERVVKALKASGLVAELVAALEVATLLIGTTGDDNGDFEALADAFYRDTGYMALGKDDPSDVARAERVAAYRAWIKTQKARITDALAKAKGGASS